MSPDTIVPGLVDHSADVGTVVSAVIAQPQKTLGKYVWATNNENYTIGEVFALTAKAAGMKDAKYLQVSDQTYESLYGKLGVELGVMFKLWEKYGSEPGRQGVLTPEDLGLNRLKSLEEYLKEQDFSGYI